MVWSTTAAGTISQIARGFSSFFTRSCRLGGSCRLSFDQFLHGFWRLIEDHALVTSFQKSPHHIAAHPAKTYHSDLHT